MTPDVNELINVVTLERFIKKGSMINACCRQSKRQYMAGQYGFYNIKLLSPLKCMNKFIS